MPAANSGSLSRTPSSNNLNKVDMMRSQSTLCRQGLWTPVNNAGSPMVVPHPQQPSPAALMKPPNGHMVNQSNTPPMMMNPRSGRSSAPPAQFRKSASATVSCASSRRGDSTEDDEELESAINSDDDNSDEHRTLRPRPVTPPKPNILKQIRRGSNASAQPSSAPQAFANGHFAQHQAPVNVGQGHPASRRRLWGTDTMRSSKSEFNLANIGRDTPVRRRNNSGTSGNVWPPTNGDRLDLSLTNPSSIPLSLDLCQHLINEMNFLTSYAARIYERASYSNNIPIVEYLNETLGQVSRDIKSVKTVGPTTNNDNVPTAVSSAQNVSSSKPNGLPPRVGAGNGGGQNSGEKIDQTQEQLFKQFLLFMQMNQSGANGNDSAHANRSSSLNGEQHFSS